MGEFQSFFSDIFNTFNILSVIDVLIMTFIIYNVIKLIKGTQASQVAKGIVIIIIITQVSDWLGLVTVNYIFKNILTVGLVALVVVFQPELRRALERLGSTKMFSMPFLLTAEESLMNPETVINEIISSIEDLSKSKTGALIVLERKNLLTDIVSTGVKLDSLVTEEILENIFFPNTRLHDGAVIIDTKEFRLKAASCLLPLSQNKNISSNLGTRHRSAIGMSEISDALVLVVSEETGVISYALNGKLSRFLDGKTLKRVITNVLKTDGVISEEGEVKSKIKLFIKKGKNDGKE